MHSLIALAPMLGSFAAAAPFVALADNGGCNTLAVNSGAAIPGNGSIGAYLQAADFQATAEKAPTPSGYARAFANTLGSEHNPEAYLTYFTLNSTYDTTACAAHCNAEPNCTAFNIFFARDPKFEITDSCTNPPPVTNIHCALFTADVAENRTTNEHQYASADYDNTFERAHIGSNGYNRIPKPAVESLSALSTPNFHLKNDLGTSAIEAASQSDLSNEYMTVHVLPSNTFDPTAVCAKHCATATTFGKRCVFFNTYVQRVNGVNELDGHKCALFAEVYGVERATNKGYEGPGATVTIEDSKTWVLDA